MYAKATPTQVDEFLQTMDNAFQSFFDNDTTEAGVSTTCLINLLNTCNIKAMQAVMADSLIEGHVEQTFTEMAIAEPAETPNDYEISQEYQN
jgi:hypothetical protein